MIYIKWNGESSDAADSHHGSLFVRVENMMCSCCGIFNISFVHVTADSGVERALTQSSLSLSLLPSLDYLWAGDDCSAGLQSGWLGSGEFLPLLPLSHSLLSSTPSAKYENVIFIWPNGISLYFGKTIYSELESEGVANERRSMLQVLAMIPYGVKQLSPPLRIYLPSLGLIWCFWLIHNS